MPKTFVGDYNKSHTSKHIRRMSVKDNHLTFTQRVKLFSVKHFMPVVHSSYEYKETIKKKCD